MKMFESMNKYLKDKKYQKVVIHCHYTGECRGTVHSKFNWKCIVPKKICIVFSNGSNYGHHFIMKEQRDLKNNIHF